MLFVARSLLLTPYNGRDGAWELAVSRDRRGESRRLSDRRAFGSRVVMALIMYVSEMHNSCIKEDKQGINYRMHTNISFLKIHSLETEK